MIMAAAIVAGFIATRPSPCCGDAKPFASIYHEPLSRLDVVLTAGDGHAFAVIAQDPLLQRPSVLHDPAELAYRAQRPVWGYLTWMGSFGQAGLTGWVLVVLTVLACGSACAVASRLFVQRSRSPWWALIVPLAAFESLTELTPELLALTLLGAGILLWQDERRTGAIVAFSFAVLTRETMVIAIAVLACWELAHRVGPIRRRLGVVVPLAVPVVVYLGWIALLRLRLGDWPFNRSNDRLSLPGVGLLSALRDVNQSSTILFWVVLGIGLCVALMVSARHDLLTWIAIAFGVFGSMLGPDVWITNAGYQRALLPLFFFGPIALIGALKHPFPALERARRCTPRSEPSPPPIVT